MKRTLFRELLIYVLILVFVPLIVLSTSWYSSIRSITYRYSVEIGNDLARQVGLQINNSLNLINNTITSILLNEDMIIHMTKGPKEGKEKERNQEKLEEAFSELMRNNSVIDDVLFISDSSEICSPSMNTDFEKVKEYAWYRDFDKYGKQSSFSDLHSNYYTNRYDTKVISWMMRITSENSLTGGVLILDLDYGRLTNILRKQTTDDISFIIFDRQGRSIYPETGDNDSNTALYREVSEKNTESFQMMYDGRISQITPVSITAAQWTLVMITDLDYYRETVRDSIRLILIVIPIIVFSFYAIWNICKKVTEPAKILAEAMKKVEENDLSVRVSVESKNEFEILESGFNRMLVHIQQLIEEVKEQEKGKRDTELKLLQAQINPHFLYNTLNVVRWKALLRGENGIADMVASLVSLLEFSGKRTGEFVTFEREIEHVDSYVSILKYQYGDKFVVKKDIEDSILSLYTPKLILQPLVENAIFHGIEPADNNGIINIIIRFDGVEHTRIKVEIKDNGVGMRQEMTGKEDVSHNPVFKGVGIPNVNERLVRYFGESARLHIITSNGTGMDILFVIPVMRTPDSADN